jgi:hypothetical protein
VTRVDTVERPLHVKRVAIAFIPLGDGFFESKAPGMAHTTACADAGLQVTDQVRLAHVGRPVCNTAEVSQHFPDGLCRGVDIYLFTEYTHGKIFYPII